MQNDTKKGPVFPFVQELPDSNYQVVFALDPVSLCNSVFPSRF